jgi:hypothetical protein
MADPQKVTTAVAIGSLKSETFLSHYADIRDLKDEHGSAGSAVARAKKAAKRDGVNLDVLKTAEKLAGMDDDERAVYIHTLWVYSGWLKMPLGAYTIGVMAPEPRKGAQQEFDRWKAGKDGAAAGREGAPRDANPYAPGTETNVAWDKKWQVGFNANQRLIAEKMARSTGTSIAKKGGNGSTAH